MMSNEDPFKNDFYWITRNGKGIQAWLGDKSYRFFDRVLDWDWPFPFHPKEFGRFRAGSGSAMIACPAWINSEGLSFLVSTIKAPVLSAANSNKSWDNSFENVFLKIRLRDRRYRIGLTFSKTCRISVWNSISNRMSSTCHKI